MQYNCAVVVRNVNNGQHYYVDQSIQHFVASRAISDTHIETTRLIGRHACLVKALEEDEATYGNPATGGNPTLVVDWDRLFPTDDAAHIILRIFKQCTSGDVQVPCVFMGQMPNTTITQEMPLNPTARASSAVVHYLENGTVLEPYPVVRFKPRGSFAVTFRASSDAMLINCELAFKLRTVKVDSLDQSLNCVRMVESAETAPWQPKKNSVVYQVNPPPFRIHDSKLTNYAAINRFTASDEHNHVVCKPCQSQGLSNRINCICGAALIANALGVGLVVVWDPSDLCDCNYEELFDFDFDKRREWDVKFVKFFTGNQYSQWQHCTKGMRPYVSQFSMLDPFSVAVQATCERLWERHYGGVCNVHHIAAKSLVADFSRFNADIEKAAETHMEAVAESAVAPGEKIDWVGVHWRRTDLTPMLQSTSIGWNPAESTEVMVRQVRERLDDNPRSVIFIATDDETVFQDVLTNNSYSLDLDRVCFGPLHNRLAWNAIDEITPSVGDRWPNPGARTTSVKAFAVEVAILRRMNTLFLTNESTVKTLVNPNPAMQEVVYVGLRTPPVHTAVLRAPRVHSQKLLERYFLRVKKDIPQNVAWLSEKIPPVFQAILDRLSDSCINHRYSRTLGVIRSQSESWHCPAGLAGQTLDSGDTEYLSAGKEWHSLRKEITGKGRPPNFMSAFIWGPLRRSTISQGLPQIVMFASHLFVVQATIPFDVLENCRTRAMLLELVGKGREEVTEHLEEFRYDSRTAVSELSDEEHGSTSEVDGETGCIHRPVLQDAKAKGESSLPHPSPSHSSASGVVPDQPSQPSQFKRGSTSASNKMSETAKKARGSASNYQSVPGTGVPRQ